MTDTNSPATLVLLTPESRAFRAPQWFLAIAGALLAGLLAALVWQSRRSEDARLIWLGAAIAVLFLPAVDQYRGTLFIETDGLRMTRFQRTIRLAYRDIVGWGYRRVYGDSYSLTLWLCVIGQNGERIEAAPSLLGQSGQSAVLEALRRQAPQAQRLENIKGPPAKRQTTLILISTALILLAMLFLGVLMPPTLRDGDLLNWAAAAGLILGLAVGAAFGRFAMPRSPIFFLTASGLIFMLWTPAAAFFINGTLLRKPWNSATLTIVSKQAFQPADSGGTADYLVIVEIAGQRKRISPSRKAWNAVWQALPIDAPVPACLAPGALGYPLLMGVGQPCP